MDATHKKINQEASRLRISVQRGCRRVCVRYFTCRVASHTVNFPRKASGGQRVRHNRAEGGDAAHTGCIFATSSRIFLFWPKAHFVHTEDGTRMVCRSALI